MATNFKMKPIIFLFFGHASNQTRLIPHIFNEKIITKNNGNFFGKQSKIDYQMKCVSV